MFDGVAAVGVLKIFGLLVEVGINIVCEGFWTGENVGT